jgi:hypothetical protein
VLYPHRLNFFLVRLSFTTMRQLLLAVLIALLPLRAWVGDAMAVSMLVQPSASTAEQAACPDHAGGAPLSVAAQGLHGAHGMGALPADTSQHEHEHPQHHPHNVCDVCNGPALVVSLPIALQGSQAHTMLTLPTERFASVALQQGIKPPIS